MDNTQNIDHTERHEHAIHSLDTSQNGTVFNLPSINITVGSSFLNPPPEPYAIGRPYQPVASSTTVGSSGDAGPTPAAPEEYMIINFNGRLRKIPLYNI